MPYDDKAPRSMAEGGEVPLGNAMCPECGHMFDHTEPDADDLSTADGAETPKVLFADAIRQVQKGKH